MATIEKRRRTSMDGTLGPGHWRAYYRDPEGRQWSRTFAKKGDAEPWLAGVLGDLARGEYFDPVGARTLFLRVRRDVADCAGPPCDDRTDRRV